MGMNFYNLVNEYRIKEVKDRLKSDKYKRLTILAIAYDSGFNSKSSFNTIFKEKTGQTPSEYLATLNAKDS
jgi:AraC-like DNA-binding protein